MKPSQSSGQSHVRTRKSVDGVLDMFERYEIRLSGGGDQGIELLGKILAEAATLHCDMNAVQTQCYGPEARSGFCRSEVIVSTGDILNPRVKNTDILLALTAESYARYIGDMKEGGVLILDEDIPVTETVRGINIIKYPFFRTAVEKFGHESFAGFIALGVVVAVSGALPVEAVEASLVSRISKGTEQIHLEAFRTGLAAVEKEKTSEQRISTQDAS